MNGNEDCMKLNNSPEVLNVQSILIHCYGYGSQLSFYVIKSFHYPLLELQRLWALKCNKPPRFEFFGMVPYNRHDDIFSHGIYAITDQPETLNSTPNCVDSASSRGVVLADITGFSLGGECIRNISRGKIFIERSTMGGVMNDERYSGSVSIKPVKRDRNSECIGGNKVIWENAALLLNDQLTDIESLRRMSVRCKQLMPSVTENLFFIQLTGSAGYLSHMWICSGDQTGLQAEGVGILCTWHYRIRYSALPTDLAN
uniref:Uncharacterized protein n=1 Tax=Glossina pallidipes TaxID=7398 RepID=A0A1B0A9C3_GLOPL